MTKEEKYRVEAQEFGFMFLGDSSCGKYNYRKYSCEKGHISDYQTQHMRRGNCTCTECYEEELKETARKVGYEILGLSDRGVEFRQVKKLCGCIEDIRKGNIQAKSRKEPKAKSTCKTCYERELNEAMNVANIELVKHIDTYTSEFRFKSCGHSKIVQKAQVFRNNLVCRECVEDVYKNEAISVGIEYIGLSGDNGDRRRLYKLKCGCIRDLRIDHVRDNSFACYVHDDTHYIKPSSVYLLKITNGDNSWLKLGYSKNLSLRISNYGIGNSTVDILAIVNFDTGANAMLFEKGLHRKYKVQRLNKKDMELLHKSNGHTECYPLTMTSVLLEELGRVQ